MTVRLIGGDDVGRMLRIFRRNRLRFYGVTVGRFGFGILTWHPVQDGPRGQAIVGGSRRDPRVGPARCKADGEVSPR